jgi:hypothetical protein
MVMDTRDKEGLERLEGTREEDIVSENPSHYMFTLNITRVFFCFARFQTPYDAMLEVTVQIISGNSFIPSFVARVVSRAKMMLWRPKIYSSAMAMIG